MQMVRQGPVRITVEYHAPESLAQALDILQGGNVKPVAGGTDFFPSLPAGGPKQSLLDLTRVQGLRGIGAVETGWRIGAATRWSDIVKADLPAAFNGLKAAAREVGSLQIQNAGTIGGNICNASPAADGVPPLLTLEAEVEIAGADQVRRAPLQHFLRGVREVDLAPGELLVALHIPAQPMEAIGRFSKLGSRSYLVISIAMVAGVLRLDGSGRIDHARIAVGACSPVAQRQTALEDALIGQRPAEVSIDAAQLSNLNPIDDVRGSADYRLEAVTVMLNRMIREGFHG